MNSERYQDTGDQNRCTAHAMRALGIQGISPMKSIGCVLAAGDHGYEHKLMFFPSADGFSTPETRYADFVNAHPTGSYLIFTPGHCIALVDGKITDTMHFKVTNRVKVNFVYCLTKKETVN